MTVKDALCDLADAMDCLADEYKCSIGELVLLVVFMPFALAWFVICSLTRE